MFLFDDSFPTLAPRIRHVLTSIFATEMAITLKTTVQTPLVGNNDDSPVPL